MKLNEPNLLIEAAESGNFAAFCIFSLLEGVNLEKISDFEDFYEEIRKKLPNCKETEDSSWFSLQEFFDFYENSENLLLEVASTQSRMKMRRAAKRTVRIRARKRAIREKLRKNKTQLAKRAYNQVKTEMRNRLSGGKPWSSLSFSTRNRIDSMISKRKPILKRLVRQRVQKMPTQESQRLRKLSMREEYIQNEINLQETSNKQRERELGRERKRRFDRRNKEDPFRLVNRSYLVTGKKGKKSIVDRDSLTKNHKDVTKLSLGEQYLMTIINEAKETTVEGACNEKDITTQRSKELGCPDKKNTEKKSKGEKKENTTTATTATTTETPREMTSPEQNQSPQLSALYSEQSPVIAQQILTLLEDPNEFLQNFQEASAVYQNIQSGADTSNDPRLAKYEQVNDVLQQVFEKMYGKNENIPSDEKSRKWVAGLLSNPENMGRIFSQYNSLNSYLSESAKDGIWVNLGGSKIQTAPNWGGIDKTSKTDLIYFYGRLFPSDMNLPDRYELAKKLLKEWMTGEGMIIPPEYQTDVDTDSVKSEGRIASAYIGGEGHAMIGNVIEFIKSNIDSPEWTSIAQEAKTKLEKLSEFSKYIEELHKDRQFKITKRGPYGVGKPNSEDSNDPFQKTLDEVQKSLNELFNDSGELGIRLRSRFIYTALSGSGKFLDGSVGKATHVTYMNPKTNEAKRIEITEPILREMAIKHRIDVGVKSTSKRAKSELFYKENLQAWYGENGEKYTKGDINKALTKNEMMLSDPNIPELKSMEYDAIKTLIDSMKATDDDPEGKILEIQKSLISKKAREPLRSVWAIININEIDENNTTPSTLTAHFSYNPLLSYLIETNKSKTELTPEQKQSLEEIIQKTQSDFIELAKTDFEIMLKLLGLEIDSVYIEPSIDIDDYVKKQKTSRANSVYVNGSLHMIPVDENPENMEENTRVTFASRFLNENKKRNYKSEYENYHSQSEQIKNRSKRNMARRWAERKGLVKKGDGKDIDHKNGNPKDNSPSNLRVRSRSANRADND